MNNEDKKNINLNRKPATTELLDYLYNGKNIDIKTHKAGVDILLPTNWGLLISRLIVILGLALFFAGTIDIFAFNWSKIPGLVKLFSIEFIIFILAIIGITVRNKNLNYSNLFIFSASFFVGIFMAVFGQVYQTGADSYTLFLNWALFISIWTIISKFAPQWAMFIIIINILIFLGFEQYFGHYNAYNNYYNYIIYSIVNIMFLLSFEFLNLKKMALWADKFWFKFLLLIITVLPMFIPVFYYTLNLQWEFFYRNLANNILVPAIVGFVGLISLFLLYRYVFKKIKPLSFVTIAIVVILITFIINISMNILHGDLIRLSILTVITIVLFSVTNSYLRKTAKKLEAK